MLKEPNFATFEEVKKQTLDKVRKDQEKANPTRPSTVVMDAAMKNKN